MDAAAPFSEPEIATMSYPAEQLLAAPFSEPEIATTATTSYPAEGWR